MCFTLWSEVKEELLKETIIYRKVSCFECNPSTVKKNL